MAEAEDKQDGCTARFGQCPGERKLSTSLGLSETRFQVSFRITLDTQKARASLFLIGRKVCQSQQHQAGPGSALASSHPPAPVCNLWAALVFLRLSWKCGVCARGTSGSQGRDVPLSPLPGKHSCTFCLCERTGSHNALVWRVTVYSRLS